MLTYGITLLAAILRTLRRLSLARQTRQSLANLLCNLLLANLHRLRRLLRLVLLLLLSPTLLVLTPTLHGSLVRFVFTPVLILASTLLVLLSHRIDIHFLLATDTLTLLAPILLLHLLLALASALVPALLLWTSTLVDSREVNLTLNLQPLPRLLRSIQTEHTVFQRTSHLAVSDHLRTITHSLHLSLLTHSHHRLLLLASSHMFRLFVQVDMPHHLRSRQFPRSLSLLLSPHARLLLSLPACSLLSRALSPLLLLLAFLLLLLLLLHRVGSISQLAVTLKLLLEQRILLISDLHIHVSLNLLTLRIEKINSSLQPNVTLLYRFI